MKEKLMEIINHQEQIIVKQNEVIEELVNENTEQENIINVMMREHVE